MQTITKILDTPSTQVMAQRYGKRLGKIVPEAKMRLIHLASTVHIQRISVIEAAKGLEDIPFESIVGQRDYEKCLNLLGQLPTDEGTIARFIHCVAQTV